MKTLLLILFTLALQSLIIAQKLVWDPVLMGTMIGNHKAQQSELKKIKSNEEKILAAQTWIRQKMAEIEEINEKLHKRLKDVSSVIKNTKDLAYASTIAADVAKYQGQAIQYAAQNPALLIVAYDTEKKLIGRSADLFTYIYTNALVGGEINLLDNRQRQEIIQYVINELRVMRGIAYGVSRQMRYAQRAGVLKTLSPFNLDYPNQDAAIANDILKNF